MALRTVRAHVQAHRPAKAPDKLQPIAEKRIMLDDQGGITELDIIEPFACGCSRDQAIAFRCRDCGLLCCSSCPNAGHALTSTPYCGNCSRLIRHQDGRVERVPRRGYWRVRLKRFARDCLRGFLSMFIDREDRA